MDPSGSAPGSTHSTGAPDSSRTVIRVIKHFLSGTHRAVSPDETVARFHPLASALGITRIADVTGLDTIGLPVVMVCRPNARSVSVSQGKGLTLAAARASGLMEAIETYHAERIHLPLKLGTINELRSSHHLAEVGRLPRLSVRSLHANLRLFWIAGRDLASDGVPIWVPFEVVHADFSLPIAAASGCFVMNTNGLASGNYLLEAVSHGICELVERDASTLFRLAPETWRRGRRVDLASVDDAECREVLGVYERSEIDVFVWDITSNIGVPAFTCTIVDRAPSPARPIAPRAGMGCHPARGVALLRALTEAAQTRLTVITGARDDVHSGTGRPEDDLAAAQQFLEKHSRETAARRFQEAPDHAGESIDDDVAWELERLRGAGFRQVIVVDLTKPDLGVPVARVVIPGLEAMSDIPGWIPGERAQKSLAEHAS